GRRPSREDAAALLVDRHLHPVDLDVVLGNAQAELAVAVGERLDRTVELLLDEPAHREHGVAQVLEILVEAPGDVMTEIFDFHGLSPARPPGEPRNYSGYPIARSAPPRSTTRAAGK